MDTIPVNRVKKLLPYFFIKYLTGMHNIDPTGHKNLASLLS